MVKSRLAQVCSLLNRHRVKYLVIGAQAGILHGLVRTTKDVDVFIQKSETNIEKTLHALANLPFRIASEITLEEVLKKPVTIIGDNPRVDLFTSLARVKFDTAWKHRKRRKMEGIYVLYLSLEDLIESKDTDRLQDQADREILIRLKTAKKS